MTDQEENFRNNLVIGDDIKVVLRNRSKKYIEKTVTSNSPENLLSKIALEEKDGWIILRKNKKSYKMAKDKPIDEQLEDELWAIVAKMGFDELSRDRNFTVDVGDDVNPRQIDVFAKDRETAICIECTCCKELKKKNMSNLIQKIESIKGKVAKTINKIYGKNPKLKIRWVIATRNIEWGSADLTKAESSKIKVLRDIEIDYYNKLTSHLKTAARYQFLSHLFSGEKISGLDITVPATRGKMGGTTFYNFLIKPSDLLKIAYVSHKSSRDFKQLDTYQRMLKPKRLKTIAEYIDNGGQFPTNIVINIRSNSELRFDKKDIIGDSSFGTLYLPRYYASAWIIDGQHRLYGYAYSKQSLNANDKTTFPVLAYVNISPEKEAHLFVDINCEQVRVSKNLLVELYSNLRWDSPVFEERLQALRSKLVMLLDQEKTSPLYGRIKTTNKGKSSRRCLTLASFADGLKENKFFGESKGKIDKPGPLTAECIDNRYGTLDKGYKVISGYLSFFLRALPDHCEIGNGPGGFLFTNNGIRALLKVFKELLNHIDKSDGLTCEELDGEDILEQIEEYIKPITNFFKDATPSTISIFRSHQALKGVQQNSTEMMSFIKKDFPDFCPAGLQEYIENKDIKGTNEAVSLINEIQYKMYLFVITKLKQHFTKNDNEWWNEGVHEKTRLACVERAEKEKNTKEREQYFDLIDYQRIANKNWILFKDVFSFDTKGSKVKQLEWVSKLNKIRNITHHAEKWPAMKSEVAFVREIHKNVMGKFIVG